MVKQQLNPLYLSNLIQTADVVDTSDLSPKYFNIVSLPKLLTSGKNLLKLAPKSGTLVTGAPVLVELIDAAGNTIYHEVLNYVGSDKSRSISIHIYPDSAPGTARIYLASVAREGLNGEILSPQSNELNVVWYADLEVSPVTKNSTEIIFTQRPTVTIRERTVPYVVPASGSSIDATVTGSGTATFQLQSYIRSENVLSGNRRSSEFIEAQLDTTYKRNIQTRPTVAGALATSGEYITVSGLGNNSIKSSGFTFTKDMVGGKVIVRNAKVTKYLPGDIANPALHDPSTIVYSASIIDVVNSSTINVDNPFKYTFSYVATDGSTKTTTINSFEASTDITASYIRLRTNATASSYTASFVDCEFTDLAPGGGSIYKIRTYYKPTGLFGDFIDNGETVLVPYNILRDKNNITASIASGIQEIELSNIDSARISTYFTSSVYNTTGLTVTLSGDDTNIIDGIQIGGTIGGGFSYGDTSYIEFDPNVVYTPNIYKNTQYSLQFSGYGLNNIFIKSNKYPYARVDVFLSGSRDILLGPSKYRTGLQDTANITSQYGTYIGTLETTDRTYSNSSPNRFENISFDFKALSNGKIRPVFVVRSGVWTFSRIQIIVPVENGFSPNYARLLTKIDPVYDNTEQIFKFQYFDYQSNQAALETIVYGPNFSGGNTKLLGKTTGTGITIRDDVGNPAELTGGGVVDITPGLIEIRNDTEGPLKLGPGTIELSGSLADTYTKIEPGVIRITSGSGTTSIYREPNGVSDNIYLPSGSGIWGTFLQNDGTGHLHWSLIAVSASYALTASYVNPLHQTVIISGAIDFKPTQDPDPNGLDVQNTFLFVSSSNTSLGQDLYIRQNGNLVKWKWFEGMLNTGLLYGGVLSYSGSTNQFSVSSGSGLIVNHNATTGSEVSPQVTYVKWPTQTVSVTNIGTTQNTYVYVGSNGSINQQSTFFTPEEYHNYIPLGRVSHYNNSTINGVSSNITTNYDIDAQQNVLIRALGPLKISGFDISGQTGTLRLNVSSGEAFNLGGYYQYTPDFPSTYTQNSSFPTASIIRIYRSGSGYKFDDNAGAYYTVIDPVNYDDGSGILQTVGNNNWSIQRVTVNPVSGRAHVYYGQSVYSTLNDAISGLASDPFTEDVSTKNSYVLSAFLLVRGNTTNLLDTGNNKILQAPLFRAATGVGGGGAGGTSTTLSALTDVAVASILDGDLLIYDNASGKWVNRKTLTGNYQITGSLGITGGVTGSLLGTSSFAVTSSYAIMSAESLITSQNTGNGPYLPVFVDGAGSRPLYVDSGLRYNATQNALTASYFKGDLVGTADFAVTASYANLAKESEIGSQETSPNQFYVVLSVGSGSRPLGIDTGLQYNPTQNALTASYFVGTLIGTASVATTASYALNGGVTQIVAGTGITISPTGGTGAVTINSTATGGGTTFTASIGDGIATNIGVTHNLNSRDIIVQLYDNSTYETIICDIIRTNLNFITCSFAVAPSTNQYKVVIKS